MHVRDSKRNEFCWKDGGDPVRMAESIYLGVRLGLHLVLPFFYVSASIY